MNATLKRLAPFAFLAVPAVGVIELGLQFYFAGRAPSFEAYDALAAPLAAEHKEGELVEMAPAWASPAARRVLGDGLMPMRDEARPDTTRYASALEISILGQRAEDLEGWREEKRFEVGKFTVRRMVNPSPAHVVFDFVDDAHPPLADVRIAGLGATSSDCPWNPRAAVEAGGFQGHPAWPPQRFDCPGGGFFNVGATVIADEHYRARRCLWSHPPARGEIVTRFHDVPLGDVIRGHGGLHWFTERDGAGAPITLSVRVDGDEIGKLVHQDGEGWKAFEFPLGGHARAAKATVEFGVSTPNYHDRHFCYEADTR